MLPTSAEVVHLVVELTMEPVDDPVFCAIPESACINIEVPE